MKKLLIVFVFVNLTLISYSQENDTLQIIYNENGTIRFAAFGGKTSDRILSKSDNFLRKILRVKKDDIGTL